MNESEKETKTIRRKIYCHFSFRRPKNKNYGLFAVAMYADAAGKIPLLVETRALSLWQDQQHITAIQSYSNALDVIWKWQEKLREKHVSNILLVTNNSTLAGWILDPRKNKKYTSWMDKAAEPYKIGNNKELLISVGLAEVRKAEKSQKFCREKLVSNRRPEMYTEPVKKTQLDIDCFRTVQELVDDSKPQGV